MGEEMGNVCLHMYMCMCSSTQWSVFMYLFSILSLHTWIYAPVHNLEAYVCMYVCACLCELVKECTFD